MADPVHVGWATKQVRVALRAGGREQGAEIAKTERWVDAELEPTVFQLANQRQMPSRWTCLCAVRAAGVGCCVQCGSGGIGWESSEI